MQPDALSEAEKRSIKQKHHMMYAVSAIIVLIGVLLLILINALQDIKIDAPLVAAQQPVGADNVRDSFQDGGTQDRDKFKRDLRDFESGIEAQLRQANLPAWNPQVDADIKQLKQQAVSAFGQGDYHKAARLLLKAHVLAGKTLDERDSRYHQAYSKALDFFTAMSPDKAKLSIDKALRYKPFAPEALALQKRIVVLPDVKKYLREAETARIENNDKKRYRLLSQVVALDAFREDLHDEITRLAEKIAEEEYASIIKQGLQAVENKKFSVARSFLRDAKARFPARSETRILAGKLSRLASDVSLSDALRKGDAASGKDDWPLALKLYRKALANRPNHARLADKVWQAEKIISLDKIVSDYIERHHRLGDPNVADKASNILQDADPYRKFSQSLDKKLTRLSRYIAGYETLVDLVIKSDNQTNIVVRGVGKVGIVNEKTIQLRPGKYALEGKRAGYKSKLVYITLDINKNRSEVEIICDEPI